MHILYFHQHFSTPKGATGTRSYEMALKLISKGHRVTMVCGSNQAGTTELAHPFRKGVRRGNIDGIDILEFKLKYSNNDSFLKRTWLFTLFAMRSIWVALFTKADLIFATSTPLTAGIPGIVARWLKGTPFVFEVRDLWPELPREMKVITNPIALKLMAVLEWVSYKSAHRLIGLSPGIVEGIKKHGINEENIALIPNGCDLELFNGKASTWRPDSVSEGDFLVVFTGAHGIANGLDSVLDAASVLKEKGKSGIKIVLIGQGKLKKPLLARAKSEELSNVVFLDPVSKVELVGLMASADLGLQVLANIPAFYYGTSPNKFFDYLASGLPVLTNYPGWVADLINKNNCGMVVAPDNSQEFADALFAVSEKKSELEKMGVEARSLAAKEFSRDKLSDEFVFWLEETVLRKGTK